MLPCPQASKQEKHLCSRFSVFILQQLFAIGSMYVDHQLKSKIELIQLIYHKRDISDKTSLMQGFYQLSHTKFQDNVLASSLVMMSLKSLILTIPPMSSAQPLHKVTGHSKRLFLL